MSNFGGWSVGVQRFRGGLVFKAHRLLYNSTLGLRVIMKEKKGPWNLWAAWGASPPVLDLWFRVWNFEFRVYGLRFRNFRNVWANRTFELVGSVGR